MTSLILLASIIGTSWSMDAMAESRKIKLRQVDVRQRASVSVEPVWIGRIRLRTSLEYRYKAN
jgi:hypothetical protein